MKFANNTVLEVSIFDEEGNLVTHLDTTKNSNLLITENRTYLVIGDALLDDKLLKFIGRSEESNLSDYEKQLHKQKYGTTIVFNRKLDKRCKLIGKGVLRKAEDSRDKEFLFEAPFAFTGKEFEFNTDCDKVSEFDFVFTIKPYNDNGDLLKMHIE